MQKKLVLNYLSLFSFHTLHRDVFELASSNTNALLDNDQIVDFFRAFKGGNKKAFDSFYNATYKSVYYKLIYFVKNSEVANDLSQDVYIEFYKNANSVKDDRCCLAFLYKTAKNIALNYLRDQKVDLTFDESFLNEPDTSSVNYDVDLIFSILVDKLKVNDLDCDILLLHAVQGYSFNDIAYIFKKKVNTIITKYSRTVSKLRSFLLEEGGIDYEFE